MPDYQVVFHEAALAEILHEAAIGADVAERGERIAASARDIAPRSDKHRTPPEGHGADSIHAVTSFEIGTGEWTSKVSWDQLHRYMRFPDLGTKNEPAQHFLEHAADRYATG